MSTAQQPDEAATGATATGRPQSVIHDLGYRGYDGPRAGRGGVLGYLVRQGYASAYGVGRTWKGKVMPWVCVALMAAPMLIAAAIMHTFNYNRDYYVPAEDVVRLEGVRTAQLARGARADA
mgnify:CR=1 FL=1